MKKNIFFGIIFFIVIFSVTSIIADLYYHYQLIEDEPVPGMCTSKCDFMVFWTAGYRAANILKNNPDGSGSRAPQAIIDYIGGKESVLYDINEPFYHFRYSPLAALFFIPLSFIAQPSNALFIWFIFLNTSLLASILILTSQVSYDFGLDLEKSAIIRWGIFLLSLRFYLMNLSNGQSDMLIALLFVLGLSAYIKGRDIACAAILALIFNVKPDYAPVLIYLFIAGRKKLVFFSVVLFIATLVFPALFFGVDKTIGLLTDWASLMNKSVESQLLSVKNQTITYFISSAIIKTDLLKSSISVKWIFFSVGAALTMISYAGLIYLKSIPLIYHNKASKYLEWSMLIIISLLFSPLTWISKFITLLVPIGFLGALFFLIKDRAALYIGFFGFLFLAVIAGTDITRFIPILNSGRFINIALGTIFLSYAIIKSYASLRSVRT